MKKIKMVNGKELIGTIYVDCSKELLKDVKSIGLIELNEELNLIQSTALVNVLLKADLITYDCPISCEDNLINELSNFMECCFVTYLAALNNVLTYWQKSFLDLIFNDTPDYLEHVEDLIIFICSNLKRINSVKYGDSFKKRTSDYLFSKLNLNEVDYE